MNKLIIFLICGILFLGAGFISATAWNLSDATFENDISFSAYDGHPAGMSLNPDGTKLYLTGFDNEMLFEFDLSIPGNISSFTYLRNVSLGETYPAGLFFKPDGTKFYIANSKDIKEYNLSDAWNISSAILFQTKIPTIKRTNLESIFFKPDGTKMYTAFRQNEQLINEYDLSDAWNISSETFLRNYTNSDSSGVDTGISFSPDGTKMFTVETANDKIIGYTLSNAWNVSSATNISSFCVGDYETTPQDIFFKTDGSKFYVSGYGSDSVVEYTISSEEPAETNTSPFQLKGDSHLILKGGHFILK